MRTASSHPRVRHLCLLTLIVIGVLLNTGSVVHAQNSTPEPPIVFSSATDQQLFVSLTQELRCLQCQNQTIADSPAGLASDLRREIKEQIEAGRNRDEIKQYMVDRYGDFILYRPRLTLKTLLLWAGPALMLLLGLWLAWSFTRQRKGSLPEVDAADIDKARSYLDH